MKEKEENETNDKEKEDSYNLEGYLDLAALIDCKYKIHCCKYSPDSDLFVVGLSDGSINIYKKQSNQLLYTLIDDDIKRTRLPVTCIRFFNPPNHLNADHYKILIACYVTGFVKFWHWPSKSCIYTIVDKETQPLSIGFNRFFDRLVVGGYLEKLKVFDVETKKQIATLENNGYGADISGHSNRVYCVKYNPNAINQIFSGGWDDTVQIWDDRTSNSTNYIYGPHICGDSIDMDANHNHVLTGSWRRSSTLQIWDMRNFELIRDIFKDKPHMMIYGSQWSGTSNIFTCGSEKNSALLYDRGTMKVMGGLTGLSSAITSIDSTDESTSLLACSQNKIYCLKKKARLNK